VSAEHPGIRTPSLGGNCYKGGYSSCGFKNDEMGNGSQGRRTAEGTVLKIRLTLRMVVMPMVARSAAGVGRAELHQEGRATCGHEPHWDIGTKDERGQQYDGQHIGSPSVTEPSLHDWGRHHARVSAVVPVAAAPRYCAPRQRWSLALSTTRMSPRTAAVAFSRRWPPSHKHLSGTQATAPYE
jgi:hypothetical protein